MKKNSVLVKQVLMSIVTAGIFSFSFALTSCSDDEFTNNVNNTEDGSDKIGNYADFEPYGLTYHNFDGEDDVKIMNADTTEIAVKKSLADKLGITNFVNHPLGIWDDPGHLAYGRKALEQQLVGDTYILKVKGVTAAELIGDKDAQLTTDWYVNTDEASVATRAADENIPEYAAKYIDNDGLTHPAVVQFTDPYGYDKDYYIPGIDEPSESQTRAAESGEFQYMTAEDMLSGTRGSIHPRLISFHNKVEFDKNIPLGKGSKDSINFEGEIPVDFELNYFLTLDGGIKWKWFIPYPTIKKFETGVDGEFGFHPNATIGFKGQCQLPEDMQEVTLAKFKGFTYTFMIGVVPVTVTIDPALKLKLDGSVTAKASLGFSYDYSNKFKAGIRWQGKWTTISEFEELEDKFTFCEPQASFGAKAGVGLFMTASTMIYGVVGPELGIGPHLGAEANVTVTPNGVDWNAEVKLTVQAWAGAKIEILGWELAEWSTTFDIIGPWTLLKLPSDGSEHKCEAEVKKEEKKKAWETFLAAIDLTYKNMNVLQKFENMIIWQQNRLGRTREEAIMDIYSKLDEYAQGKRKMFGKFDINKPGDPRELSSGLTAFDQVYFSESLTNKLHNDKKNWEDITATLKDNALLRYNVDKDWVKNTIEESHKEFVKKFNREPEQKPEDIKWLMDYIMDKQNTKCLNDLKPYMKKVNEVKDYMTKKKLFLEEPNAHAVNYSIWVVFTMTHSGKVNTVKVETLAQDVYAVYDKFAKCFNY